jgi:hypothetical protein
MGEPKVFASLSSGLLARKGAARPAMRPQGFGQLGGALEDLGWNDMGFEAPKPALAAVRDADHDAFGESVPEPAIRHPLAGLTPIGSVASPVHDQQAELADRFKDYDLEPGEEDEEDLTAEPLHFAPAAPVLSEHADEPLDFAAVTPVLREPANEQVVTAKKPSVRRVLNVRAAPGAKAKAAFTLRLDPARHLKLRLACAVTGRSAQVLVTEALDELLAAMPELDGMAERAPRKVN